MSLFAAGVVLFVLLVASYSGRRFWLALASTAVSMAAFVGFLFVAIAKEPTSIRAGLVWTAGKLQLVVDQETADMIAKAIAQIPPPAAVATTASTEAPASLPLETKPIEQAQSPSPCATGQEPPCDAAPSAANAASIAEAEPPPPSPPATEPQSIQATSTPSFPAAKPVPAPAPKATPGAPVVWFLDDQQEQASGAAGAFAINGMNASDQPFEEVHAVLKPDGGRQEIALALNVDGQKSDGVIPAGARFSLGVTSGKQEQIGGAILTFRYRQNGQVRTSIVYLTPAMISRFANRG